jgi:hypothetical protein
METDAIITMVIAMLIVWGGLAASTAHAVRASRAERLRDPKAAAPDG